MTKQEFLNELREALLEEGADSLVAENLRYYENYIEGEKAKGRSENDVFSELGSPRLIARSIFDAAGYVVDGMPDENPGSVNNAYETGETPPDERFREDYRQASGYRSSAEDNGEEGASPFHVFNISGNTAMLIFVGIMILLAVIFWLLMPILLPLVLVLVLIQLFRGFF